MPDVAEFMGIPEGAGQAATGQSGTDLMKSLWGTATWPKPGQAHRPPLDASSAGLGWVKEYFGAAAFCACVLLSVFGGAIVYSKQQKSGTSENGGVAELAPLIAPRLVGSNSRSSFVTHFQAICVASVWRHLHRRALWILFLRTAFPAIFLVLMYRMRSFLATQLNSNEWVPLIAAMGGTSGTAVTDALLEYAFSFAVLYMVMMSMPFFVQHISAESDSGLRHLLHASGLSRPAYLMATVLADGCFFTMLGLLAMLAFAGTLLQIRFVMWSSLLLSVLVLFVMVLSATVTGYVLHFLTPSARLANIAAQFVVISVTFAAPVMPMSPRVPLPGEQSWRALIFPTIPTYRALFELLAGCVKGRCLVMADIVDAAREGHTAPVWSLIFGASDSSARNDVLTPPAALLSFLALALVQLIVNFVILVLLDMRYHPTLHASGAQGTQSKASQGNVLEVQSLEHRYGWLKGIHAFGEPQVLNGVSFEVAPGAILGLLGPNGAGKTTCIRCITGEEAPSKGSVAINSGLSANTSAYIGLCPQETVLIADLTVMENLLFFANVRGANTVEAARFLEHFLTASSLSSKRHCLPDTLSGGMRRRLSVACALIGAPAVAILDEPTTGLDPLSRRGLWDTIFEIKVAGSCCLLTTHMLEEAEALCSKLVVLRQGGVVAAGSVQQLKEEWGTGYMLNVDCKPGFEDTAREFVARHLPEEDREPVKSTSNGQMTFKLKIEEEALGHLIIAVAQGRQSNGIRHWGVSQASLEDTYLHIIQKQPDDNQIESRA